MNIQGFREIDHAADWELEVWAPTFTGLLEQAVLGINELSGIQPVPGSEEIKKLSIEAEDLEMLLMKFLTEILFFGEVENLGFNQFLLSIQNFNIDGKIFGYRIGSIEKQIKAVMSGKRITRTVRSGLTSPMSWSSNPPSAV